MNARANCVADVLAGRLSACDGSIRPSLQTELLGNGSVSSICPRLPILNRNRSRKMPVVEFLEWWHVAREGWRKKFFRKTNVAALQSAICRLCKLLDTVTKLNSHQAKGGFRTLSFLIEKLDMESEIVSINFQSISDGYGWSAFSQWAKRSRPSRPNKARAKAKARAARK
jgi:hypothetical protein